ncbi:pilin, partial [Neisseria gonorrhoeae]
MHPYGNLHHVIPTKVGIQDVKSQETFFPDKFP